MPGKLKREWQRIVRKLISPQRHERLREFRRRWGLPSVGKLRRRMREGVTENSIVTTELELLNRRIEAQSESIRVLVNNQRWLLQHRPVSRRAEQEDSEYRLVSVIMPVWNREHCVAEAIQSVCKQTYPRWELLIVDDGSQDATIAKIQPFLQDSRIRLICSDHIGHSAARNKAFCASSGEIITYLDSDNVWMPHYLESVAETFDIDANCSTVFAIQLVENQDQNWCYIRDIEYSREKYLAEGGIDLNVFAHRRELTEELGGFDEQLTQLVDWDLIARYTEHHPPHKIAIIGCQYRESGGDRVSISGNYWRNRYLIQRKWQKPFADNLRVLYIVNDFPQLTETYMRWEIDCMRRWGVDVHVWSRIKETASPYETDVPHHQGELDETIEAVRPNVVHFHWMNVAEQFLPVISRYGAIATVRGHGFEYSKEQAANLITNPTFMALYAFPHYADEFAEFDKMQPMNSAFNGDLFYPEEKDPWLVVRTGSAKKAKAVTSFIDTALHCPRHRFVLILGRLNGLESYVDEVIAYNESKGNPVEIRVNVPAHEAAALVRRAGIYLHTYGDEEPFGMPVSIAEAMATGAVVLVRDLPGAAEYVGQHGRLYQSTAQAATLIRQTENWYTEDWKEYQRRTVEYAYQNFADIEVYRPMLECWWDSVTCGVDPSQVIETSKIPELQPVLSLVMEENRTSYVNVFGRPFLTHLLGTYNRLKKWNADDAVCLAGLVHSLYNAIGQHRLEAIEENRTRLKGIIGVEAEQLAYLFQSSFRAVFDEMVLNGTEKTFVDRFTGEMLTIDNETFQKLAQIHLAEWMEKRLRVHQNNSHLHVYQVIANELGGPCLVDYQKEVQQADAQQIADQKAELIPNAA